jgi:DNA invertase Pin-like site-specific DNA recombinase
VRGSTDQQAESGAGLADQQRAIRDYAKRQGWEVVEIVTDNGVSAKTLDRAGLKQALAMMEQGQADVIVAAKLDRLSRSVRDFADLLERSRTGSWSVVVLDAQVDTTTPEGEAMVGMQSVFAQLERRLISQRTKNALAVKKAQGVKLGRRFDIDESLIERMRKLRRGGKGYSTIAGLLNTEGIKTARGGAKWYASTVKRALEAVTNRPK